MKNTEPQSGTICYTLFWRCTIVLLCLLPATASRKNLVQKNQFPELNRHIFRDKFYCLESHILHWWRCSYGLLNIISVAQLPNTLQIKVWTYGPSFLVSLLFCLPLATTQFADHDVCTTPVEIYHMMEPHLIAFLPYYPFCTFPQLDEFGSKVNPTSHGCQTKPLILLLLTSLGSAAPPCK